MTATSVHHEPRREAPDSPLLAVFAALIILGVVVIGLMLAFPSVLTAAVAFATVIASAVLVAYLLARMIGEGH
jgi:hypothetical protein